MTNAALATAAFHSVTFWNRYEINQHKMKLLTTALVNA